MKLLLFVLFNVLLLPALSQSYELPTPPRTDKRIELLSIVFRLAGNQEYSSGKFKSYVDAIQAHFASFKDHELIRFTKQIGAKNGIGYDAVMTMAIHIDSTLTPLVPFSNSIPDKRWGKENALTFLKLLKQFYTDANCETFFKTNSPLYQTIEHKFNPLYTRIDFNWFQSFYGGVPNENFTIIIGVGNGHGNYGPSVTYTNGKREVYAIMGVWDTDSTGVPLFKDEDYLPLLIHEFNHSFVNHLIEQYKSQLSGSGSKLYTIVKRSMQKQAYGDWKTMLQESVVRASVINYMQSHHYDSSIIQKETHQQLNRSFLWINELCKELNTYKSLRSNYPTLESYMPRLINAFQYYAQNSNALVKEVESKRPHIISIKEFNNHSQKVSPQQTTITFSFDKPMRESYSFDKGPKGQNALPQVNKIHFTDEKTLIMDVKLEPKKTYQFMATGYGLISKEGLALTEYLVQFKTGK